MMGAALSIRESKNIKIDNNNGNINNEENICYQLNNKIDSSKEIDKGEFKENKESNKSKEEENIMELIPLSYRCLNKKYREKYITLDRKKQNLIYKNATYQELLKLIWN